MARLAPGLPVAVVLVELPVIVGLLPEEAHTVVEGPEGSPVAVIYATPAQVVQSELYGPAQLAHSHQQILATFN
jgi:hypothetical protein